MIVTFKTPKYEWLSNFYPCEIEVDGIIYPTVEHAYVSFKNPTDVEFLAKCRDKNIEPGKIKKEGEKINIHGFHKWKKMKVGIMRELLIKKYTQEPFRTLLLETKNQNIQEGNYWGDRFWGVDLKVNPNEGENYLGRLTMNIRHLLAKGEL